MKKDIARFQLGDMVGIAVAFVVVGITIGLGATVITQVQSTQTSTGSGSYAYNASTNANSALNTLSGYLPILGTVAAAAVVIGIVVRYLAGGHN